MAQTITIDPVTRIEGHLEIEVTVDMIGGEQQVIAARSSGTMFRGFEIILIGRDPRDASMYTQRICGVCPVSHALAACMNLEDAFGVVPPDNGRILRNLVLGANYIQSHILHFYHLSVLDYIDTTGLLDAAPWMPRYQTPDMLTGSVAADLVGHYVQALEMRRKAHQMGALFGGKLPCLGSFVVGGCTEVVTNEKIAQFRSLLSEIRTFVDDVYLPDAQLLGAGFPGYFQLGRGNGNLLAFGVFDEDGAGSQFLPAGRVKDDMIEPFDPQEILEDVTYSWYEDTSGDLHPANGLTEPDRDKAGAYSWLKAPTYLDEPHEMGPLARMWLSDDYRNGISAMDRIVARAVETQKLATAMDGWLDDLVAGQPTYQQSPVPETATGAGLTEAPRGGLGHWMNIENSAISRYQVITPTNWNAAPKGPSGIGGPIEAALVGVPVADLAQPVEVLRVVHSYDPCLACAVHMVRPGDRRPRSEVIVWPNSL